MELRSERYFRPAVAAAEARHRALIAALLPEAEVEHIGATAVAGALTKGDLDLMVVVEPEDFASAAGALRSRYSVNQPENWTDDFASFAVARDGAAEVPVGVQLVAAGSEWQALFLRWRKLLTVDPAVRHRYNELKRAHADAPADAYVDAKAAFIEAELAARSL